MAFKKAGGFRPGGQKGGFTRTGGQARFANKGFSRGGDSRPPQMFSATCAECRKVCEVPFRPNGEKPVFCRDCFGSKRDSGDRGSTNYPRRDAAPTYAPKPAGADTRIDDLKRQVEGMNKKLDSIYQLMQEIVRSSMTDAEEAQEVPKVTKVKKAKATK